MKRFFLLLFFRWRLVYLVKFKVSRELKDWIVQPLRFPFQNKDTRQRGLGTCPRSDMLCSCLTSWLLIPGSHPGHQFACHCSFPALPFMCSTRKFKATMSIIITFKISSNSLIQLRSFKVNIFRKEDNFFPLWLCWLKFRVSGNTILFFH